MDVGMFRAAKAARFIGNQLMPLLPVLGRAWAGRAVLDVTPHGLKVVEIAPGVTREELQSKTGVPLQ